MDFGTRVRTERNKNHMSLEELASQCDVSRAMLSKIERNEKIPTIRVAAQIAESLDVALSRLLGETEPQEAIQLRPEERFVYQDPQTNFTRELLSPSFASNQLEFILNTIPKGEESGVFPAHNQGVEEYIYMLQGSMVIELENATYHVGEQESLYYKAHVKHRFINQSDTQEAQYLLVIHPT